MAAKLAAAREKNRLAQQRFRERRRLRQQQAGEQCEVVQQEIDQVRLGSGSRSGTAAAGAGLRRLACHPDCALLCVASSDGQHCAFLTCPVPLRCALPQLGAEIEALRTQNRIYQKVLAVRDAMLATFTSLQPPEAQAAALQQPDAAAPTPAQQAQATLLPQLPAPEAAGGLAHALSELPSEGELDAAAQSSAAVQEQAAGEGAKVVPAGTEEAAGAAGSGLSSGDVGDGELPARMGSAPQSLLGEAHRTGTASSLDGSALQEVEEVPPPSNQALLARIQLWAGPEDLVRRMGGCWAGAGWVHCTGASQHLSTACLPATCTALAG